MNMGMRILFGSVLRWLFFGLSSCFFNAGGLVNGRAFPQ